MRWYVLPAVGIPLGLGAAYLVFDKFNLGNLLRMWIGAPAPSENYIRIQIPFTISDMDMESAKKVADSLKPRDIVPVLRPLALDFYFAPIQIPVGPIQFRWQPPKYRHLLLQQVLDPSKPVAAKPTEAATKKRAQRLADSALKSVYQTKMERTRAGWKITVVMEIPV